MLKYIQRRLLVAIPVVWGVTTIVFFLMRILPGDPAQLMLSSTGGSSEQIARLRQSLGLNDPLLVQYGHFLSGAVRGDLGPSFRSNLPVTQQIKEQLPATLQLTVASMVIATIVGVVLGIASAVWQHTWVDSLAMSIAMVGICAPAFWLGLILIFLFSFRLHWFPATGSEGWNRLVLPAITLGLGSAAVIARLVRSSMIEALHQEYVVVARSKGLSEARVTMNHALKNALIPAVTLVGLQFGYLLGGAVIVESVFSRQGIGRLAVQAIVAKDYTMVQGVVLFVAIAYVLVNLIVDLLYGFLDPRIRYE
ncbi:MAG TPA: nickel ABC transporter permease [Thermomicrobiales bacterium]|jgi:ABC-type dipeptide/oligopeptide/nickel transport system permease component